MAQQQRFLHPNKAFTYARVEFDMANEPPLYVDCRLTRALAYDDSEEDPLGVTFHDDTYCYAGACIEYIREVAEYPKHLYGWQGDALVLDFILPSYGLSGA